MRNLNAVARDAIAERHARPSHGGRRNNKVPNRAGLAEISLQLLSLYTFQPRRISAPLLSDLERIVTVAIQRADSDEVAQAYRYEVARGFRDDVAHLSDLISPSGEAFWPAGSLASVKPRGQSGIATSTFFLLLRLLWACGQRDCVVQAQRHVHGAQVFRADCRVRRRLSPVRSSRWALWTRRSSTASA